MAQLRNRFYCRFHLRAAAAANGPTQSSTPMDDFANLVSRANPAASQYQPAGLGYPPSSSTNGAHAHGLHSSTDPEAHNIFLIDDDEDEPGTAGMGQVDGGAFRSAGMASVESGLPFAGRGAPVAGHGNGMSWEDTEMDQVDLPGPRTTPRKKKRKISWEFKWPWSKEKVREGDRVIALNDDGANISSGSRG